MHNILIVPFILKNQDAALCRCLKNRREVLLGYLEVYILIYVYLIFTGMVSSQVVKKC